jgi:transcriptional regulator with XRE-family HTH domain
MEQNENALGSFLKERRARLQPTDFGLPVGRRRTPGLRREEVAQLAHVSATWYTWLEQGRGGAPSADVLDRLSRALSLTEDEREHLYLLAQERPPKAKRAGEEDGVSERLQRVLDALVDTPAIVKTPDWTVMGWNKAALAVLTNYADLPPHDRNILRMLFGQGGHSHLPDWKEIARLLVGSLRRDILRAGMTREAQLFVEDMSQKSEEFRLLWEEQEVTGHGGGTKRIEHAKVGLMTLEFSTFAVDGRPDLALVMFNPATDEDREKIRRLMAEG